VVKRQTDRQTDKKRDRQTDRQIHSAVYVPHVRCEELSHFVTVAQSSLELAKSISYGEGRGECGVCESGECRVRCEGEGAGVGR
jgi:hypothetical protein